MIGLTTIKRVSDSSLPCGLPGMTFQSDSGVILVNLSTPFGMTAKLFDGNEVEIFQGTRVEEGVHGFFHVFVAPFPVHVSQQVADDPALRRFDLLVVLCE